MHRAKPLYVSHNCSIGKDCLSHLVKYGQSFGRSHQATIVTKEKVVILLNSMTLDPLPFFLNSFNPHVAKLTSSLLREVETDVSKDTFPIAGDVGEIASSKHLQPSLDVPPVTHDVAIV